MPSLTRLVIAAWSLPATLLAQSDKLDAYMHAQMEKSSIPGACVIVIRDGRTIAERAYGVASVELEVPASTKTVFPLASITKTLTGTAVMMLVEQNRLTLDSSVRSILPEIPAAWSGVTVRQLLGHTSGLPDVIVNPVMGIWLAPSRTEALEKLAVLPILAQPGQAWSYNQTNYMLLGMIIEKLSGLSFDDFLKRSLIDPAGMKSTTYGDSRVIVPGRGPWYSIIDWSAGRPKRAARAYSTSVSYPDFIHTAAGLNATAGDLARFAEAVAMGRLLKPATRDHMWTAVKLGDGTTFRMEKTLGVGLGWLVDDRPGHRSVGGTGGSSGAFRHYRDDRMTVVVLTNLQGIDPDALVDGVAALYVPALASLNSERN